MYKTQANWFALIGFKTNLSNIGPQTKVQKDSSIIYIFL